MNSATDDSRPIRVRYSDSRRWVLNGALIGTLAYTAITVVSLRAWGWDPSRNQIALVLAALGCAAGAGLAARGHMFMGGRTALLASWCEVNYSLLTATGFPAPSLLATAVLLVAASLLLTRRQSAIFAVVSIVISWPLVLYSPAVRDVGVTPAVIYFLTAYTVVGVAVWSLVTLGVSIVDRAFDAVVRKERELSETIERAPDGILVIDSSEVLRVMNPAAERALGLTAAQSVGRPISDVLLQASARGEARAPLALHDTGERPCAWSLTRLDGVHVELEVTWRSMDEGRRQLVLRDVSERLRAEHARRDMELQLAHAQRLEAVGQLAGGIAHDFNNILTIVGASAEVIRAEMPDARLAPLVDEVLAAQERGAALTRQLLAFARREVVHPQVFDLSGLVVSVQRLLQRVAGEQTRVLCSVEPDCRIRADLGQVEQALVNLVTNARDAMPEGGNCTLSVVRMVNDDGSPWVRLRVSDEGVGMDAATSARAFEPFFTTKPRGRGTGLGLSAVHGMVMQSGGRADIESQKGRGTTVVLEFPFASAASTDSPESSAPALVPPGGGTILVAEDDDGTRATVARVLQRLGYRVLLASDGDQALRLASEHRGQVDLLLTDVMMPGMSGPRLAARFSELAPDVPVVFMSGYPEDALAEVQGLHLESDFVAKPFTSGLLARRISDKLRDAGKVSLRV